MNEHRAPARSVSGSSLLDSTISKTKEKNMGPLTSLFEAMARYRDAGGKPICHDAPISLVDGFLRRCRENGCHETFLLQRDAESGYSFLHNAIYKGELDKILVTLRFALAHEPPRISHRVWDLLDMVKNTSDMMSSLVSLTDKEGFTPAMLLRSLAASDLQKCRDNCRYRPCVLSSNGRQNRSRSYDELADEQEELHDLSESGHLVQTEEHASSDRNQKYSCEIVTFGASGNSGRPQRMHEFALHVVGRQNGITHIAAAQHHTMIVTRLGQLYAFGHHQTGRLGIPSADKPLTIPSRVSRLNRKRVVHAAAAVNHSMCVTSCGRVYTWGSNRFGQLGDKEATGRNIPKSVDELREQFCVAVAAGDKHSVALTSLGEIFVWGSNEAGQLGLSRRTGAHKVQRLESLWSCQKIATTISAAHESSLAIVTSPERARVPAVYAWGGHNCSSPSRVLFTNNQGTKPIVPIDISCGKYHNVAVSADGHVYTWGIGEMSSLGINVYHQSDKSASALVTSPQLVEGMLPEHGGGLVVECSASDTHTAVVTRTGDIFMWGHSLEETFGHHGVKWQPCPDRVPGVHQAIGVSVAKEHTIVMVGTFLPDLPAVPLYPRQRLEDLAARNVASHVDLFNVVPICMFAERHQSQLLSKYCMEFVKRNLSGVLNVTQRSFLDEYLNGRLLDDFLRLDNDRDIQHHPLLYMTGIREPCYKVWGNSDLSMMQSYEMVAFVRLWGKKSTEDIRYVRSDVFQNSSGTNKGDFSLRFDELTHEIGNIESEQVARSRLKCLQKESRGIRKKLSQITTIESSSSIPTKEQRDKIARKPKFLSDLCILDSAISCLQDVIENMKNSTRQESLGHQGITVSTDDKTSTSLESRKYVCSICSIKCPDQGSLQLHLNGRRHRNKVAQMNDAEDADIVAQLARENHKQRLDEPILEPIAIQVNTKTPWASSLPRYNLASPPSETSEERSSTRAKPHSLLEIMKQEHSQRSTRTTESKIRPQIYFSQTNGSQRTGKGTARVALKTQKRTEQHRGMYSLGDFFDITKNSGPSSSPKVSWASPNTSNTSQAPTPLSLMDIQLQQEKMKDNEVQSMSVHGKWYIAQRERASSLHDIQREAERKREEQLFVQEQLRIEQQIMKDLAIQQRQSGKGAYQRASHRKKRGERHKKLE